MSCGLAEVLIEGFGRHFDVDADFYRTFVYLCNSGAVNDVVRKFVVDYFDCAPVGRVTIINSDDGCSAFLFVKLGCGRVGVCNLIGGLFGCGQFVVSSFYAGERGQAKI